MKTALFDFVLSESLIATYPASPRDSARMLVVGETLRDAHIRDLLQFLQPGDVMVFNDTKVIPARLFGRKGQGKMEVLLHKRVTPSPLEGEGRGEGVAPHDPEAADGTSHPNPLPQGGREYWQCFAKPAKRLKIGDHIDFAEDFHATVIGKLESGEVVLQFDSAGEEFRAQLIHHGQMPLPPYIERHRRADAADRMQYQTVYAQHEGSVAAPTAGLHFTNALLAAIDMLGVKRVQITLHVGGGTFLPVKAEDTQAHAMHSEYAVVTPETAAAVNAARARGGRVIAVGTTSLRTLESVVDAQGILHPFAGETAIFITPGYRFKLVDRLLTNFHLPRSTLFMLVCAFSGLERMQTAYRHAIQAQYRFYSYGDACLLSRADACP